MSVIDRSCFKWLGLLIPSSGGFEDLQVGSRARALAWCEVDRGLGTPIKGNWLHWEDE